MMAESSGCLTEPSPGIFLCPLRSAVTDTSSNLLSDMSDFGLGTDHSLDLEGKVIFMRIYIDLALSWTKGVGSDPLLTPSVLPFEGTIDSQALPPSLY